MANLILLKDILPVLEKGCWHSTDQSRWNICEDCASDIRSYILSREYGIYTPSLLKEKVKNG